MFFLGVSNEFDGDNNFLEKKMNRNGIVKLLDYFRLSSIWVPDDDSLVWFSNLRAFRIIGVVNCCIFIDRSMAHGRSRGRRVSLYG